MYEKEKVIRLSNLDDVHEFVGAASKAILILTSSTREF